MRSRYLLSLALAALVLIAHALAQDESEQLVETIDMGTYKVHRVQWMEVEGGYEDILAQCGDHVEFVWDKDLHNVGIAEKGDCAAIRDGTESSTSGNVTYVLDELLPEVAQHGEVYFACDVGSHCEGGQKLEFYVEGCEEGAAAPAGAAAAGEGNSATARGAAGMASLLAAAGVAVLLAV